jgi:hypothetical protein
MPKRSQSSKATPLRSNSAPPPFSPTVVRVPNEEFKIADAQFAHLENAGGIKLVDAQRTKLLTLAISWIDDLRIRRTPRPRQFRKCLDEMDKAFAEAQEACQWDQHPQYHLVHWAMETRVEGADGFPVMLAAVDQQLSTMRKMVLALKQCLPADPGRQRPFNDERRIIFLADVFEEAGGKAVVYAGGYYEAGSMTDTPFRRFAQHFYTLLPADDKRDPGGLDDALRDALATRRAQRAPAS